MASGNYSHAQNIGTIARREAQTVIGKYNVEGTYALIVGNGTANDARSNAATIDWNGNAWYAGDVTDGTGNVLSDKLDATDAASTYLPLAGGVITGDLSVNGAQIVQSWAGVIQMFAGATPPAGWLLCDGSAVSRTTYATLYAAIGDTWGAGDGSTTFNLPDLRGRAPIGAGAGSGLTARTLGGTVGVESVTLNAAQSGLRAHTHSIQSVLETSGVTIASSRAATTTSGGYTYGMRKTNNNIAGVTATGAVTGGAADATSAHDNMQPSAVVNFIIHTGKTS